MTEPTDLDREKAVQLLLGTSNRVAAIAQALCDEREQERKRIRAANPRPDRPVYDTDRQETL